MNALATVVAVEPTGWSGRRYHPPTTPAPLSRSDVRRLMEPNRHNLMSGDIATRD